MGTALETLSTKLAERFDMGGNGADVVSVLKATAFKGPATDAQLTALLVVAQQYGLNPFTKEIYAFPDKNNGIVPVVGVDGWSRIINGHEQFDGLEFKQDDEACTCIIYRKDRSHSISVTEYMSECRRGAGPWVSHPKRMLRHKALIQCARLAFGYTGIFDQDEAERIVEIDMGAINRETGEVTPPAPKELPAYTAEQMDANVDTWRAAIASGKTTPERIAAMVSSKYTLSADQIKTINGLSGITAGDVIDGDFVADMEGSEQ